MLPKSEEDKSAASQLFEKTTTQTLQQNKLKRKLEIKSTSIFSKTNAYGVNNKNKSSNSNNNSSEEDLKKKMKIQIVAKQKILQQSKS